MIWKFLKQNLLFPKGLNWVQRWVSWLGLFSTPVKVFKSYCFLLSFSVAPVSVHAAFDKVFQYVYHSPL